MCVGCGSDVARGLGRGCGAQMYVQVRGESLTAAKANARCEPSRSVDARTRCNRRVQQSKKRDDVKYSNSQQV